MTTTTITTPRRIGPEMERVVDFVGAHPGLTKSGVARGLRRPLHNCGVAFGPIDRAIRAGLIRNLATAGWPAVLVAA